MTCQGRPTFCYVCCLEAHSKHPLHRVEFWEGEFYRPAWLRQVGLQVHCGHSGAPCPLLPSYSGTQAGSVLVESEIATQGPSSDRERPPYGAEGLHRLGDVDTEDADTDSNDPLFTAELESDFEDEDADLYLERGFAANVPLAGDLPWIGEGSKQPQPSTSAPMYANDRMLVVVDIQGEYRRSKRPSRLHTR